MAIKESNAPSFTPYQKQLSPALQEVISTEGNPTQYQPKPAYSESILYYIQRLEAAKMQRNSSSRYFDDQTYEQDYLQNENAKNTYLRAKLNDSEVRVNTGTTEKKLETLINKLLAMNLKHEVRAYDKEDLEIQELGDDMSDIVTRTNQIEKDDDFWQEAILELLTQRTVFIEEGYVERSLKNRKETIRRAEKKLWSGLKVFFGDITIPTYRQVEQPYQIYYESISYDVAKSISGHKPDFKFVKMGMPISSNTPNPSDLTTGNYRFGVLQHQQVERIIIEDLYHNERVEIMNGVLLDAPGTPMPGTYCGYSVKAFTLRSVSNDFAYGRSIVASSKSLQALDNEMIRNMVRKFQQSIEPPLAVPRGKVYSRRIWDAGAITNGIAPNTFERLTTHDGPTQSEFAMYDLITKKTEEFVGAGNLQQGLTSGDRTTATEVLTLQKQAVENLGLAVMALKRMKRDMTEMRIYTVVDNYLTPQKKAYDPINKAITNIYQKITLNDTLLPNNRKGKKVIQFMERDLQPNEEQELYEYEKNQEEIGNNIRIKFINAKKLAEKIVNWFVVVTQQPEEGSSLDKVIFQDQLAQATAISQLTQTPLNGGKIIEDFERKWRAKDWFQKQAPQQLDPTTGQPMNPEMAAMEKELGELEGNNGTMGAQVAQGLRGTPQSAAALSAEGL